MNIFDLAGPDFLRLFVLLMVLATLAALLARVMMSWPYDSISQREAGLNPFEIACVAGGRRRATEAAMTTLAAGRQIFLDEGRRFRRCGPLPPRSPDFERAVYEAVPDNAGVTIERLMTSVDDELDQLAQRPTELGLVLSRGRALLAMITSAVFPLAVVIVGLMKIGVGISRDKPVGILLFFCAVTSGMLVGFIMWKPRRSVRGWRFCAQLLRDNAGLRLSAATNPRRLSHDDMALAMGLLGAGLLAGTELAGVGTAMRPPPRPAGSGFSWGGSGCGALSGGGCGGSGCGGGGCGGGGCGGCGGS